MYPAADSADIDRTDSGASLFMVHRVEQLAICYARQRFVAEHVRAEITDVFFGQCQQRNTTRHRRDVYYSAKEVM